MRFKISRSVSMDFHRSSNDSSAAVATLSKKSGRSNSSAQNNNNNMISYQSLSENVILHILSYVELFVEYDFLVLLSQKIRRNNRKKQSILYQYIANRRRRKQSLKTTSSSSNSASISSSLPPSGIPLASSSSSSSSDGDRNHVVIVVDDNVNSSSSSTNHSSAKNSHDKSDDDDDQMTLNKHAIRYLYGRIKKQSIPTLLFHSYILSNGSYDSHIDQLQYYHTLYEEDDVSLLHHHSNNNNNNSNNSNNNNSNSSSSSSSPTATTTLVNNNNNKNTSRYNHIANIRNCSTTSLHHQHHYIHQNHNHNSSSSNGNNNNNNSHHIHFLRQPAMSIDLQRAHIAKQASISSSSSTSSTSLSSLSTFINNNNNNNNNNKTNSSNSINDSECHSPLKVDNMIVVNDELIQALIPFSSISSRQPRQLHSLTFIHCQISDSMMRLLFKYHQPSIQLSCIDCPMISLDFNPTTTTITTISNSYSNNSIRELDLSRTNITLESLIPHLQSLRQLKWLTLNDLSCERFDHSDGSHLMQTFHDTLQHHLPQLMMISLDNNEMSSQNIQQVLLNSHVHVIHFTRMNTSPLCLTSTSTATSHIIKDADDGIDLNKTTQMFTSPPPPSQTPLSSLAQQSHLIELNLSDNWSSFGHKKHVYQNVEWICDHLIHLRKLNLNRCNINNACAQLLLSDRKPIHESLTFLDLSQNSIDMSCFSLYSIPTTTADSTGMSNVDSINSHVNSNNSKVIMEHNALDQFVNNTRIKTLLLSYNHIGDVGAYYLSLNNHVSCLYLNKCYITDKGCLHLLNKPNIARIHLRKNNVSDQALIQLSTATTTANSAQQQQQQPYRHQRLPLRMLDLGYNPNISFKGTNQLIRQTGLTFLSLRGIQIGNRGTCSLFAIPNLVELDISHVKLLACEEAFKLLGQYSRITKLHIKGCALNNKGAAILLHQYQHLKWADMSNNELNDEFVAMFRNRANKKHLTYLNVVNNAFSSSGIKELKKEEQTVPFLHLFVA